MMDAYASHGMPVNYRHWSYGKHFMLTERDYKRGQMGLAYEIVINSDPCIAYLMEENTMTMQALVIAHAAYGHNLLQGQLPVPLWTDASAIIDYLVYARNYIAECEERHGFERVEELLDSCHALMNYGVDRYKRPTPVAGAGKGAPARARSLHAVAGQRTVALPAKRKPPPPPWKAASPASRRRTCSIRREERPAAGALGARGDPHRAQGRQYFYPSARPR
jgi:spore cortex formation protein SpoVR/YcgB (stage V sporulation)